MVEVVARDTDLRRAGARCDGLCPFHDERTPSFSVEPEREALLLLRLRHGGDAINFVQEKEGLDFREAVELLAERYGVELEREEEDPRADAAPPRRERLLEAAANAPPRFYERYLWESGEARRAREYLDERGLAARMLREFGVGYAPSAWDRVLVGAPSATASREEELAAAGPRAARPRAAASTTASAPASCFRCATPAGGCSASAPARCGRASGPKYVNTSESDALPQGPPAVRHRPSRARRPREGRAGGGRRGLHGRARPASGGDQRTPWRSWAPRSPRSSSRELAQDARGGAARARRRSRRARTRCCAPPGWRRTAGVELRVVDMPEGTDPAELVAAEGAEAFAGRLGWPHLGH